MFALAPLADISPRPFRATGGTLGRPDDELVIGAVVLSATVLYLAYHLAIRPASVRRLYPDAITPDALSTRTAYFRRALGTVLFGLLPALALVVMGEDLGRLGLNLDQAPLSLALTAGTLALVLPFVSVQRHKPAFLAVYPEVRDPFTPRVRLRNALSWTAYLFAYELFFRGLLLFPLAHAFGPLPAVAVMVMAYVFVHLDKYPGEAIGTLFTGTAFGVAALYTGSILMPFLAHLFIALTNDELAARARASAP